MHEVHVDDRPTSIPRWTSTSHTGRHSAFPPVGGDFDTPNRSGSPAEPAESTTFTLQNAIWERYVELGLVPSDPAEIQEVLGSGYASWLPPKWERSVLGPSSLGVVLLDNPEPQWHSYAASRLGREGVRLEVRFLFGSHGSSLEQAMHEILSAPHPKGQPAEVTDATLDLQKVLHTLRESLGLTYDQLATMTGIGRTTFFTWTSRRKAKPRPSTLDPLLHVYAPLRAVVDKLGPTEAAAWLRTGSPSPLSLLLQRDFEAVEDAAAAALFAHLPPQRAAHEAYAPDTDFDVDVSIPHPLPRVVRAQPRVMRTRGHDRSGK